MLEFLLIVILLILLLRKLGDDLIVKKDDGREISLNDKIDELIKKIKE